MIVGLTGLTKSGKDTAADYLVERHGFVKIGFGDAIYEELAINFNVSEEFLRARSVKEQPQQSLALVNSADQEFVRCMYMATLDNPDAGIRVAPYEFLEAPRTSKWLAQHWGTDYRRTHHGDDYWNKRAIARIRALLPGTDIVLNDLRFAHEMPVFATYKQLNHGRAVGGVMQLIRTGTVNSGHSSDRGLAPELIDYHYLNDRTIADLHQAVDSFILRGIKCL